MNKNIRFGIIGLGKVGGSIFELLLSKKLKIYLFTKSLKKKNKFKEYFLNLKLLVKESDLIFICTKDDQIENTVRKIKKYKPFNKKFIHLSGATPLNVLSPLKEMGNKIGKFHPIQSFPTPSKKNFKNIYASFSGDKEILDILKFLFKDYIKEIIETDDLNQQKIHLACVFASNFPIFILKKAHDFLKEINIDFKILEPIIRTSFENALIFSPEKSLTGPAVRKDMKTIKKHLNLLKKHKKTYYSIYNFLTKEIIKDD